MAGEVELLTGWVHQSPALSVAVLVLCLFLGLMYLISPTEEAALPEVAEEEKPALRDFTPEQLRFFDGTVDEKEAADPEAVPKPIYVALKGAIFDVSKGRDFYGPGESYGLFAGRDASRALAKMSFEALDLDKPHIDDLNSGERDTLDEWHAKFEHYKCYPIVGQLSQPPPPETRVTPAELLATGSGRGPAPAGRVHAPHLIGIKGLVYDVSFGGVDFYGEGCSYNLFCGRDAARALAKMSFKPEDVENSSVEDLDAKEQKILADWIKLFARKYPVVATIVAE